LSPCPSRSAKATRGLGVPDWKNQRKPEKQTMNKIEQILGNKMKKKTTFKDT
jgi:hypothetical protein